MYRSIINLKVIISKAPNKRKVFRQKTLKQYYENKKIDFNMKVWDNKEMQEPEFKIQFKEESVKLIDEIRSNLTKTI